MLLLYTLHHQLRNWRALHPVSDPLNHLSYRGIEGVQKFSQRGVYDRLIHIVECRGELCHTLPLES